jgi:(1->4)-alpha-D-glucan 1-alpha-D-glucosylmutase
MEEPDLFAASHQLILRLVREQKITGLRLDHLDGLFDPGGYLDALQDAVVQEWTGDLAPSGISPEIWRRQVHSWRTKERNRCAASVAARPLFVAIEKILMGNEALPKSWPIHGTSGYVFLNDVIRLFVNPENAKAMTQVYERFTGQAQAFADVTYECKKLITSTALASELNVLAVALNRISEGNRRARDFTLNYLREALRETVACFPVYRTYLSGAGASEADRQVIDMTLARAKRRNPMMEPLVFGFLRQVLLPRPAERKGAGEKESQGEAVNTLSSSVDSSPAPSLAPSAEDDEYRQRLEFAMKFQQYTGPVQAKGVEDTAFYRYNRLLSLNEVGGEPQRFGGPPEEFHEANRMRLAHWPHAMLATATHDTKRGEDARARLNVLSEIPTDWRRMIFQWSRINNANRTLIQGEHAPHRNDEYLFYQALLGAWPVAGEDQPKIEKDSLSSDPPSSIRDPRFSVPPGLVERLKEYMLKAVREAKVFSSWINPNEDYDQGVADFVTKTLTGRRAAKFLASFLPFQERIARLGMVNSLAQVVLKIISPGVPDFYQGTELWDFSLVDPDNRRPVDFAHRIRLLESLESISVSEFDRITDLLDQWPDGRIKLLITTSGLRLRRKWPRVFIEGEYLTLEATGEKADHIVAIARRLPSSVSTSTAETRCVLAIVPRLVAGLVDASVEPERLSPSEERATSYLPVGANTWKTTRVILPDDIAEFSFRNIITGQPVSITPSAAPRLAPSLLLADVLSSCPVALLEGVGSTSP